MEHNIVTSDKFPECVDVIRLDLNVVTIAQVKEAMFELHDRYPERDLVVGRHSNEPECLYIGALAKDGEHVKN